MIIKKYSKSSSFYFKTKNDYFKKNKEFLKKTVKQNILYASQPKRINCKICGATLPKNIDFHSHHIDYVFCIECNHLNGLYEDTKNFIEQLYIIDEDNEYAKNYIDKNYLQRTKDIYMPKVDFLISSISPKEYNILDIGCGSGYFVFASLLRNLSAKGIDISQTMIEFGNNQIANQTKKKPLSHFSESSFFEEIINTNANIISAIGVIEHLREPHKFFNAFKRCKAQYLFYSVPMFSVSAVLENIFTNVFPRHLSAGHTHVFTEKSIIKLNELNGIKPISEWRFGTDVVDLYRHILVELQTKKSSQKMIDFVRKGFEKKLTSFNQHLIKTTFVQKFTLLQKNVKVNGKN